MGKLRILSAREVCTILRKHGFEEVRQRGSQSIMQKKSDQGGIPISENSISDDTYDISRNNYDVGIKEICSVFQNKTLDFLGLDLPLIVKPKRPPK